MRRLNPILFAFLLFNSYAEEERKVGRPGMISNQEYKDGMEQKKLSINDPEQALVEPLWKPCAAISLGDGYSMIMQFRQAHPMAAEYQRRVMVFEGDARRGRLSAALQLNMNFGGRTHMLIYRHLDELGNVSHVTFEAKEGGAQTVRLNDPDFEKPLKASKKEYIGLISGEAYPLKFVTPLIVSEASARKKLR